MRFSFSRLGLIAVLTVVFVGCGGTGNSGSGSTSAGGSGSEPSESEMKDAMTYAMNHPPGEKVSDPINISFFKKEACDPPTAQGWHCTFDVKVTSSNLGASMYNNISFGEFYKDKDTGKWNMRPPF